MAIDPRDLRALVGELRGAVDNHPKEALVEILTYVFKEYVVESGAPLSTHAARLIDTRSELDGMSFPKLVEWLQLHLDLPELALLEVQGDHVQVRVGGRMVPLEAAASRPEPVLPPRPVEAPAPPVTRIAATAAPAPARPATAAPTAAPAGRPAPAPAAPAAKPEEPAPPAPRGSLLEVD